MVKKDKKDASFSGIDDEVDEVKFTLEQEIRLIQEVMRTNKTLLDAKMDRQIFKLEKEEDWPHWKKTVLTVFGAQGIRNLVCSDDGIYEDPLEAIDSISDKALKTFNEEYNDNAAKRPATKLRLKIYYNEILTAAYTTLFLCLSEKFAKHAFSMNNDEARELWEKLVSLFERKTASSLRRLKQKFLHCHQLDDEPFMKFYERMRSLAYQLNELDEVIDDADVMSALFTGVADKFYPVVDNLENDDNMNLERAVERIRDFEQKLMNRSRRSLKSRSRSEDTFYVNTDVKKELCRNFARGHCHFGDKCRFQHAATRASNEGKPRNQDKVKCYNCNKHGHYARECRKPDKRKGQQKYNRQGKDSQASHLYEDYDSLFITYDDNDSNDTVSAATEDNDNDWLIDSGASRHMVKSNTNLLNRRPLDPPIKLHLADRTTVHTLKEVGDMKIKTGKNTLTCT